MNIIDKDQVAQPRDAYERLQGAYLATRGEKPLYETYKLSTGDEVVNYIASVDGGSTGTRVKLLEFQEGARPDFSDLSSKDYYEIPSDVMITDSIEGVQPSGQLMYDLMVSKVANFDVGGIVKNSFMIRGSLLDTVNKPIKSIGSTGSKVRNEVFYYNIIDAIAYAFVVKGHGKLPRKVNVALSVSLPPEDESERDLNFLKSNLKRFVWHHATGGEIEIEFTHHFVITEPQAQALANQLEQSDEQLRYAQLACTHTIEGGGRSIGNNVTRGYNAVKECKKTLDYGAKFLMDRLAEILRGRTSYRISRRAIQNALETGIVVVGKGETINVVNDIIRMKDELAERMAVDIKATCYDSQRAVLPTEITDVVMSGGLFRSGDYDYSLAVPLSDELSKFIPKAEFTLLEDNLIPLGLMLHAIAELGLGKEGGSSTFHFAEGFGNSFGSSTPNLVESNESAETEVAAGAEVPGTQQQSPLFSEGFTQGVPSDEPKSEGNTSQAEVQGNPDSPVQ